MITKSNTMNFPAPPSGSLRIMILNVESSFGNVNPPFVAWIRCNAEKNLVLSWTNGSIAVGTVTGTWAAVGTVVGAAVGTVVGVVEGVGIEGKP